MASQFSLVQRLARAEISDARTVSSVDAVDSEVEDVEVPQTRPRGLGGIAGGERLVENERHLGLPYGAVRAQAMARKPGQAWSRAPARRCSCPHRPAPPRRLRGRAADRTWR